MPRALLLICSLLLVASCSKAPEQLGFHVVQTKDHDPACYTQGLEFFGNRLFESGGGYGTSSIREVDPKTGKVLRTRNFPAHVFAEGITILNDELFVLTWLENTAYVFEPDTFKLIRTHKYEGEGWGLTHNSSELIMSNGSSSLQWIDPKTFAIKRSIEVTDGEKKIDMLNELEFIDGQIYANLYLREDIVRIDAKTGAITGRLDLTPLRSQLKQPHQAEVLNGIAQMPGSEQLLITGKLWPNMFEIEITE